jgi:ribosomal protein S6E (S10)
MEIPLKYKYRVHHGVIKRGAPMGMGTSGKHRKKKLPAKQKAALAPQPKVTLHIDKNGRRHWIKDVG